MNSEKIHLKHFTRGKNYKKPKHDAKQVERVARIMKRKGK